jgi:RTX calcium-binding nonapeptide repeat (4 copies)
MGLKWRALAGLVVVALGAVSVVTIKSSSGATKDKCNKLHPIQSKAAKFQACTHGGDARAKVTKPARDAAAHRRIAIAPAAAPCPDGGTSGKRIEVIYGVPQDRVNQYSASVATIRDTIALADGFLDSATPSLGGQHYRWLCENGSDVTVRNATLLPVGGDNSFNFTDMFNSLVNQTGLGLGNVNYDKPDRIYLTFVDQIQDVYPFGGQGTVVSDDTPNPAANLNNDSTPEYSLVAYYDASIVEHELGHNMGAVQLSAPHSSGAYHCYEQQDEMCYNDGGSYFTNGGQIVASCPNDPYYLFDCGHDDYYAASPPAGSYLDTHWNTKNSDFLTPLTNSMPQCTITGTAAADTITGTSGDDYICGLGGNDIIRGVGGNDVIDGGGGIDQVNFGVAVTVDLGSGTANGEGSDTLRAIENIGGSPGADSLTASTAVNTIRGNGAADRIAGLDGNDQLYGNSGNDYLAGGLGNDAYYGGPGTDTCVKSPGTDGRTSCERSVAP